MYMDKDESLDISGARAKQSKLEVKAKLMNQRLPLQSSLNGIAMAADTSKYNSKYKLKYKNTDS